MRKDSIRLLPESYIRASILNLVCAWLHFLHLVEVVELDKLLRELYTPDCVSHLVQGWRPECDAHHVGDDEDEGAAHAGFGGEADLQIRM